MSHRLEVTLTSRRPDGTWTWRVTGARHPKGVLEEGLLPAGVAVGDVLRVEAEMNVDGIAVRQVLPPKEERPPPSRVEHLGSKRFVEGVTGSAKLARTPKERAERPAGRRSRGGDAGDARQSGARQSQGVKRGRSGDRGGRERPQRAPRLRPASRHRETWLETLSSEERTLAERLATEGIRAVRQSFQADKPESEAQDSSTPDDTTEARLAVVERLFSALREVDWRDRAEEARKVSEQVDLRDLRSAVAGTPEELPDEESRALAKELRSKLEKRVDLEHSAWIADLGSLLRKGRMVTALRVSQRPPKAGTPLPESLARGLQEGVTPQLNANTTDDLWGRMLEAAAQSPIRLVLLAQEVPPEPSEGLLRTVRRFGERLPALRAQFKNHLDSPAEDDSTKAAAAEETQPPEPEPDVVPEVLKTSAVPEDLDSSVDEFTDADATEEVSEPSGEVEVV